MSNILTIAYTTEGSTDQRFLLNIIRKTFEEVALNCKGLIDVYDPVFIKFEKKKGFVEDLKSLSAQAFRIGINIFCVHVDADDDSDLEVLNNKIRPAFETINNLDYSDLCKNLVAIVPIQMSEAWMLADKSLLKEEIGTDMSDQDLNLTRHPESIANPKQTIEAALIRGQSHLPSRRKKLTINDLYQPLGQKISIERLESLESYKKFRTSVEGALRKLNYLN
jgi:hypothetical protein